MSAVTLPSSRIPLTANGDAVSVEFYRWMHDITQRVGGVAGPGTEDLALSQFDDAGIEETKEALLEASDAVLQLPLLEALIDDAGLVQRLSADVEELRGNMLDLEVGTSTTSTSITVAATFVSLPLFL